MEKKQKKFFLFGNHISLLGHPDVLAQTSKTFITRNCRLQVRMERSTRRYRKLSIIWCASPQSSIVMLVGGCKVQMQSQMYRWFSKLHTDRYLSYFIFFPLKFFTDTRIELTHSENTKINILTGTVDSLM